MAPAAHNGVNNKHTVAAPMEVSVEAGNDGAAEWLDDDGRPCRMGTFWTASAHIITAAIGSGVLSLAWAIAQLGWVAAPTAMLLFAFVTYYTATLLAECYRTGDPETGKRDYTYEMDAVRSNLGGAKVAFCGVIQYANLVGVAIGYSIASSISMKAIRRAGCFYTHGHAGPCKSSSTPYMIILFGVVQIFFSQIPDSVTCFTYSSIGLSPGIARVISIGTMGSLTGISIGADVTSTQKVWHCLQAFGDIAFAYSFSCILIEIQDTIKAPPPSESKVMQKATRLSVATTTIFYFYMLFGDNAPGNRLTGFGFCEPFWLVDVANTAIIVVHLVGAYQVLCQPIFAFVERRAATARPDSAFISLYAVFRDAAPDNLLTVLGFYEPFFWLLDIANIAIVLHIVTPMLSPACRIGRRARMPKTAAVKGSGRCIGRAEAVPAGRSDRTSTLTRAGDCSLPPHTCDWFRIMGSAIISTPDKSCVISAAIMCMAAQYSRFNKKYEGANSWSLKVTPKVEQSLKDMCYERGAWHPFRGAPRVEGVLDVICSLKKGIPTCHDSISLRLKSYQSFFGQLSPREITSMLRKKGPVIGVLYAGEESYLSSTVYRGNRFAVGDRHAVVCTGCRKVNGELCVIIMDNLEREGPFRFVLHEALEEFHVLTVDAS